MFTIDITNLGGVARRKNGSEEEMFYNMIHYNLQEDTVILFAGNSLLEPGDVVIPHIEYEARVNFNVMSGYGVWRQPCEGAQGGNCHHVLIVYSVSPGPGCQAVLVHHVCCFRSSPVPAVF